MSARAGKRPMRSLTAHEKLEAIRRVHDGESKASVARDIGVPESTLRGWCKNEDKISYLSRQSSPDTDESLESQSKKPRVDDAGMQPFNLSMKSNGFSPNSEARYAAPDCSSKNEPDVGKTMPLNLNTKTETIPKTIPVADHHATERERNRAELARMSVELGLNRPEMFLSSLHNTTNLADLTANINLLAHWNTLLIQQQQHKLQQQQQPSKSKVTAPADTSSHVVPSSAGLLTTVDQDKNKHPPKEQQQSMNDSIWYWLSNQQKVPQSPLTGMSSSNGVTTSISTPPTVPAAVSTSATLNGLTGFTPDQSSWFWKWYKKVAYEHQLQSQQFDKPILYQQLTKEAAQKEVVPASVPGHNQQNAENLSVHEEKPKTANANGNTCNGNKARAVLDNLLLNNNNNVAVNKKDTKEDEERISAREALEHGEKFLKWLESCCDPSVTAVQIMQYKTLLHNAKTVAERKSGDLQNKAKVKRK